MEPIKRVNKTKKLLYSMAGLAGISLIILIHELGHFFFAQFFGVPTPSFSLGFGPKLLAIPVGKTVFTLGLLPFGGYVEMDQEVLAQLPYLPKCLFFLAAYSLILFLPTQFWSIMLYATKPR